MTIFVRIIAVCWLVFLIYWLISAAGAKRRIRGRSWWAGALFRVVIIIGVIELHLVRVFRELSRDWVLGVVVRNPQIGLAGIVLCVTGVAFAIWARHHLGRNWGMPMTLQEGHELVVTGPYARVRHPIYTGILLAMLGTMLVVGPIWFILFVIICVYFVHSAKTEEKLMMQQFPNEYPAYRERTKMLLPFVW